MTETSPIEKKIYSTEQDITSKRLRLKQEKKRLKTAREQRAKVEAVHMELHHKDFRLEPALWLFDRHIRDIVEETDLLANQIRHLKHLLVNLTDLWADIQNNAKGDQ